MSKAVMVYQCEKCHSHWALESKAEECCTEIPEVIKTCRVCDCKIDGYKTICSVCLNQERFANAKKVKYSDYKAECLWDETQDAYFRDKEELEDKYYEDVDDAELHLDPELPTWCFGCTEIPFRVNIESAIESAEEDMYEDFNDIECEQDLINYVEAWNKKQTGMTYETDYKTVVLLNE